LILPDRPRGGFRFTVEPTVQSYIESEAERNPRILPIWDSIISRLKVTALKEGTRIDTEDRIRFTVVADGAPEFKIPTIQINYDLRDGGFVVVAALVWTDDDHEADDRD
jgi:hypothetical protein